MYALDKPWDLPNTRSKADANKKVVAIYDIKILTSNIKANGQRHFDYLFTPCKLWKANEISNDNANCTIKIIN